MSSESRKYRVEELICEGLLEIGDGYRAKNSELTDAGIPFARAGNINDGFKFDDADFFPESELSRVGSKVSRPGDVVFTSKGTVGRFAFVEKHSQRFVYSPQLCFWRSLNPDRILPEYLYYWMNSQEFLLQIGYLKGQTDMADYVSLRDQRQMAVTIPSIQQQRYVVDCLKPIDQRITLLRETNISLEAIAQAIYKSWFVDFDPVCTKEARPDLGGIDASIAAFFPDGLEQSDFGLIPRGWNFRPIGELVEGIYDGPHATPAKSKSGPVFLGIKNLTGTRLELINTRYISEEDWSKWTRRVEPTHGDIVFSYEATLGFFALIPPNIRCCLGRRLALIRPHTVKGAGLFWFHQFISLPFQQMLDKHTIHGATVNRIALKAFPRYLVLNPPEALKMAFHDLVEPLWGTIHNNQAQLNTLIQLRDTLLPPLVSGQMRLQETSAAPRKGKLSRQKVGSW